MPRSRRAALGGRSARDGREPSAARPAAEGGRRSRVVCRTQTLAHRQDARQAEQAEVLRRQSLRPIFHAKAGDLTEIAEVARQERRIRDQGDARNSQVHRFDAPALAPQRRKSILRFVTERQDVHSQKPSPQQFKLFVGFDHLVVGSCALEIGLPALDLLLKANDGCRDVVGRQLVEAGQQSITGRSLPALQDGEMVGVEQDGHESLLFPGSAPANLSPKANDLREVGIACKASNDLSIPRLPGPLRQARLQVGEFLLDQGDPFFQFSRVRRHLLDYCAIALQNQVSMPLAACKPTAQQFSHSARVALKPLPPNGIPFRDGSYVAGFLCG
jgi:hypothetical protein